MFQESLKVVLSENFLSAIFSTIFIILMGYYLRKKNIVNDQASKVLSSILLSAALPALAFNAFMADIKPETYTTGINVLIFGFVAYVILIGLGYLFYFNKKGDLKDTLVVLTAFGSTTFFGIPIINGLFGATGTLYANIFNIAYRVFLYSFALIVMSGTKFDRKNLKQIFANPIIIATFLGLILWAFQAYMPQVSVMVKDPKTQESAAKMVSVFRIDKTLPWVFKGLKYLGDLSSPLAWLAIGMTLASISLKEALNDKLSLVYAFFKLILIPAIFFAILVILNSLGIHFEYEAIAAIIIMLATPPATVAVAYAIKFEKEAVLASNISLVNTVLAIFAIICWIIILAITNGFVPVA
ncbi:AEC family transporter [Pseudostreptobacillus hongkongensis]|uniref:AEC family transporter n=1 Tax=Pseudostreptobacillus hongkongensis TaxID=1162717 RepID=UPI00082D2A8E|nr:AEC family transporter [Pseudostreptobacillus hongkongensis]